MSTTSIVSPRTVLYATGAGIGTAFALSLFGAGTASAAPHAPCANNAPTCTSTATHVAPKPVVVKAAPKPVASVPVKGKPTAVPPKPGVAPAAKPVPLKPAPAVPGYAAGPGAPIPLPPAADKAKTVGTAGKVAAPAPQGATTIIVPAGTSPTTIVLPASNAPRTVVVANTPAGDKGTVNTDATVGVAGGTLAGAYGAPTQVTPGADLAGFYKTVPGDKKYSGKVAPLSVSQVTYNKSTSPTITKAQIDEGLDAAGIPDSAKAVWHNAIPQFHAGESGGNPNAVNMWDSNAWGPTQSDGAPLNSSRGGMQTIPSTFAANHAEGTSTDVYDPVANTAAGVNYLKSRYGIGADGTGMAGFLGARQGGWVGY